MKILKADVGALNNFEVLEFLKSKGASNIDIARLAKIKPSEYKVFDYLVNTPAGTHTRESVQEFKEKCRQSDIGNDKILNIINTRPASVVEIYALVELVAEVLTPPTAPSLKPEAGNDEIDAETMSVEPIEQNDGSKD
ncbi:PREDICTED: DNA-directed RNA polymerase III subunit rpc9-like [Fragaria vesca subsp. vesca]